MGMTFGNGSDKIATGPDFKHVFLQFHFTVIIPVSSAGFIVWARSRQVS